MIVISILLLKTAIDFTSTPVISYFLSSGLSPKLLEDIYGYTVRHHKEKITKLILSYITANESIKDLMTPVSSDDITKNLSGINHYKLSNYFLQSIINEDMELLKHLLKDELIDILEPWDKFDIIQKAIDYGNTTVITFLLERGVPHDILQELIDYTIEHRNVETTKLLRTYINKTNESIRDKMTPKSFDDINNSMSKYTPEQQLLMGCKEGQIWLVRRALELGVDINHSEGICLMWGCLYGYYNIVRLLLSRGAKVTQDLISNVQEHNYGEKNGIVNLLWKYYKTNEGVKDLMTPYPTDIIIKKLSVLSGDKLRNKLMNSLWDGEPSITDLLIQHCDVNTLSEMNKFEVVRLAVTFDYLSLIKWVLDSGGMTKDTLELLRKDSESQFKLGITGLIDKYMSDNIEKYNPSNESLRDKMVPKSSEEIRSKLSVYTPNEQLMMGVRNGELWLVKKALMDGADLNFQEGSPFIWACINQNSDIMDYMIEKGVKVNNEVIRKIKSYGYSVPTWLREYLKQHMKTNESVRDKMTPKSFEDINDIIDSLDVNYEPYKNIIKTCAEMYVSVSLNRINDHSYRYTFKLDNLLYTVSCYHLSTFTIGTWKMRMTVTRNKKFSKDVIKDIHSMEDVMNIIGMGEKILD